MKGDKDRKIKKKIRRERVQKKMITVGEKRTKMRNLKKQGDKKKNIVQYMA